MKLWVVSLSFKNANLDERSAATIAQYEDVKKLSEGAEEFVWLSTCNRLELYGTGSLSPQEVVSRWGRICNLRPDVLSRFQIFTDRSALVHLFRVTASLESMVLGENQIHGQVKKSYLEAQEHLSLGPALHRCFQSAFRTAKRVKSETEVGQFAVSIPSIGVKLAQKVLGNFSDKVVGVIGLGEIGRVAAEHFGSVGPKSLLLYNRTGEIAEEIAEKLRNECVPAETRSSLEEVLENSHVLVSAVSTLILTKAHLQRLEARSQPPFILDLSVPPSVESHSSERLFIYGVDDLQRIAEENSQLRQQELDKAGEIVFEEAEKCWRAFELATIGQTFERLTEKVGLIREKEMQSLRRKLPHLSPEDWLEIEKMSNRLSEKIVQDPVIELRSRMAEGSEKETWLHFFRNMFRI